MTIGYYMSGGPGGGKSQTSTRPGSRFYVEATIVSRNVLANYESMSFIHKMLVSYYLNKFDDGFAFSYCQYWCKELFICLWQKP